MSSLKDLASLIMIPSLYKDGRLDTVKPLGNSIIHPDATGNNDGTDGSTPAKGNFTFSRGSNLAATRVDVNGLIEKGRDNEILQSNSFSTSPWSLVNNSTLTSGQSGYDGGSDAWLLTKIQTHGRVRQSITASNSVNTFSIYAKGNASTWLRLLMFNGGDVFYDLQNGAIGTSSGIDSTIEAVGTTGWYRCTISVNNTIGEVRVYPADGDGNTGGTSGSIYIQDAQLEAGLVATDYIETGASTAQAGILEDMPRLDYSGSCPALLLEPQRTNSITQSEYFGSSFWTKSGDVTLTSNYGISPEGYQNADRIVANATAGGHIVYRNISTTGTHTISVFAKASGYNHIFFGYDGGNLNFGIVFNLSNGTISQNPAGLTGDIEAIGSDGWYRCNLTFNYSTTNYYFVVSPHDNSSAYSWTGNGTDGILIYGAQIEYNSSYPTSYIPTYGSSVTRSVDKLYKTGIADLIGQTEGTFFIETTPLDDTTSYTERVIQFEDGGSDLMGIQRFGNSSMTYFGVTSGGTQWSIGASNVFEGGRKTKIAAAYANNDIVLYVDGVQKGSDSSASVPTTDRVNFANNPSGSLLYIGEHHQVVFFPTRLTNAELAALTTI